MQPDVIEWLLKLNTTQAQEEYHKLDKANRELKKENEATRKSMVELEGAVLKFEKAVGTNLASACAFTGAALRIFGKEADKTESVLASFAVATTKSSITNIKRSSMVFNRTSGLAGLI